MPDWLLYWVWPWALIGRPKAIEDKSEDISEFFSVKQDMAEQEFVASANLASIVLSAGNSVFVPDEVIDFVFSHDCCAISFKRSPGGVTVSVVFNRNKD